MRRCLEMAAIVLALALAPAASAEDLAACYKVCGAKNSDCKKPVLPAWQSCMAGASPACKALPSGERRSCQQRASVDCSAKGSPVVEACEATFSACVDDCKAEAKQSDPAAAAAVAPPSQADEKAALAVVCGSSELKAAFLTKVEASRGKNERAIAEFEVDEGCAVQAMPTEPRAVSVDAGDDTTHAGNVNSARYSGDGKTIVSGGDDGTIRFWDAETGRHLRSFKIAPPLRKNASAPQNSIRHVRFVADDSRVVVSSDNGNIVVVDVATGKILAEISPGPEGGAGWRVGPELAVAQQDTLIVAFVRSRIEEVWAYDLGAGAIRNRLSGHVRGATALASSNAAGLVATGMRGAVLLWRADTWQSTGSISRAGSDSADTIAFSRDGRQIAIGFGPNAEVYDLGSKSPRFGIKVHPVFSTSGVVFTADGKALITCRAYPVLWDIATGKAIRRFGPFLDVCQSMEVSPDGKSLLVAARASDMRIWDIATGTFQRRLGQPKIPWHQ
ncbi:MAG: WD40 repeat domain-containing protein [Proteobacteria bacterium]|nr:WD40 repeat domain-containing protein [Pseudomonadota bacterium]